MIEVLIAVILLLPTNFRSPPDLSGLATYYGPPAFCQGDLTASGEPLNLWEATAAVDHSQSNLLGTELLVLTECRGVVKVRVNDLGNFKKYCEGYRLGRRKVGDWTQERYFCEEPPTPTIPTVLEVDSELDDVEWIEETTWPMILDFPIHFRESLNCHNLETIKVWVWIIKEE